MQWHAVTCRPLNRLQLRAEILVKTNAMMKCVASPVTLGERCVLVENGEVREVVSRDVVVCAARGAVEIESWTFIPR